MAIVNPSHTEARELCEAGEIAACLRRVGPLLEANPNDHMAWLIGSRALGALGETAAAATNLRSLATALAEAGNPILALCVLKEVETLGTPIDDLLGHVCTMYGAGSKRLMEVEIGPPPLPASAPLEPWPPTLDGPALVARIKDVLAMAWGAAMVVADRQPKLPYLPLLSALPPGELKALVHAFERRVWPAGAVIVAQDAPGDALHVVAEGEVVVRRRLSDGRELHLARLSPGAFFGEMALVTSAPRAASVVALGTTVTLEATKARLESLAARLPVVSEVLVAFCHARMLENVMRVSPALAPVPAARRPAVVARFATRFAEAGQLLIAEGQSGPGLFVVASGKVQVTRSEEGGERLLVATLGPGDLFGEISLLLDKPSTATVTAVEGTALLFLSREEFHLATREYPELLKGAFDVARAREQANRSILAAPEAAADDLVLV